MIGDTTFDLEMARAAGVAAVAVLTGTHERSRLIGCDPLDCLKTVAELPDWLDSGRKSPDGRSRPGEIRGSADQAATG